jgi:hypothetical protein
MITALFHKCYYAFLRGNLKESQMFFDFLKEEFRKTGDRNALNVYQLRLLKRAKTAIDTGKISRAAWLKESDTENHIIKEKPDKSHKELVRAIYEESSQLKDLLGDTHNNFHLDNIEQPCPPHGRADMVYLDSVYAYPVEVKPGTGGHDVVGQILKYEQALQMRIHIRFWEDVRPVTICWGYSDFALNELKRSGVTTIQYRSNKKGLKLTKV